MTNPGTQPYYPNPYYPPPRSTNGFAVASLVLGILWLYWVGSILAVIFGAIALSQIKRTGDSGKGMAVAGLVLGYVGLGVLLFMAVMLAFATAVG